VRHRLPRVQEHQARTKRLERGGTPRSGHERSSGSRQALLPGQRTGLPKDATLRTRFSSGPAPTLLVAWTVPGPVCLDEGVAAWIVVGMDATTPKGT
jgi:hypothetical protein